jgi:hypothetical protein
MDEISLAKKNHKKGRAKKDPSFKRHEIEDPKTKHLIDLPTL